MIQEMCGSEGTRELVRPYPCGICFSQWEPELAVSIRIKSNGGAASTACLENKGLLG
jgi:hypothetical protein